MKPDSPFRKAINAIEVWVSVFAMLLLILVVFIQVFCRYVLQDSLAWTEELARYLVIWSVLFGCSFAMRTDSHLELSILSNFSGPRMKKYVKCFSCIVCLAFSIIMVYAGMESVINIHWNEQLTPAMQLPAWIIWMAMPAGFGLMGIQAILRCVDEIALDSFPLLAVPFFIVAGDIMQKGTIANSLLAVSRCLVGHIKGGMAHISILTSLFYGALSGSAAATVAAVGGIMIPAMEKEGYPKEFATAVNSTSGCLGIMIPPSIPLILFGSTAGVSISDLFVATIVPGILMGCALMLVSYVICVRRKYGKTVARAKFAEMLKALYEAKWAIMVPVIVLGGIYGGITTPTEAGAIAVVYALFVEVFITRSMTRKLFFEIIKSSVRINAAIFLVVASATALGQIMMYYNLSAAVLDTIMGISTSKVVIMALILVVLLILGTFLEAAAIIMIVTPLLLPVINAHWRGSRTLRHHHAHQLRRRGTDSSRGHDALRGCFHRQDQHRTPQHCEHPLHSHTRGHAGHHRFCPAALALSHLSP